MKKSSKTEFKIPSSQCGQRFRDYNPAPVSPEVGQKAPTEAYPIRQRKQIAGVE